jgi:ATP-dependent Lhr-like helicase
VIVPKYRGDLLACAAAARAMLEGHVEATRYPRTPLDVLAQQVVAMASMDRWAVDDLYDTVRRAAPYAGLGRGLFERVLDMLSGRYPSDDFAELRPRLTWDRAAGTVVAREGARRVAVINGGTIPDRGLYGVFLASGAAAAARSASPHPGAGFAGPGRGPGTAGAARDASRRRAAGAARVGELDEEMVFESRAGETFVLGASTWRIEEITHDRVLVSPAPGEPGKMPFWRGDAAGRPLEFGRAIGALVRTLDELPAAAARERLVRDHRLDARAADNLLQYLRDQKAATGALPDDRTILVERCRDELGEWRVCVLSPFGSQVLAPWALAASARVHEETGLDVETMWTDDGFVVRFPETERPPEAAWLVPPPEDVERLVVSRLGSSPLLAAAFRECAARALLLPRRRPGARTPLWQQRKRASDLLAVAARFGDFPILLEAYRECLRDVFDLPALVSLMADLRDRAVRLVTVDTATPSPFAASLLFGYVATYLYDGDAPLAERRAQALAIDHAQLRELVGETELRDLLDAETLDAVERQLQHLEPEYRARSADGLHDLLLRLGDLTAEAIAARAAGSARAWMAALLETRRAIEVRIAGERRLVAVEDAARYRDALGTPLPPGLPTALLAPVADPLGDLVLRHARTHAPFTAGEVAARYGLGRPVVEGVLHRLAAAGRLLEGAFRPGGREREWCAPDVLAAIRRRARAELRREVEPVEAPVLARLLVAWQGAARPRAGLDGLLDAIEQLQGAPLVASALESEILPARVADLDPAALDTLLAAGEVVWVGLEPLGERDGRLALFLADHLPRLWRPRPVAAPLSPREQRLVDALGRTGASFFAPLHEAAGGGYPGETLEALWNLVWKGIVTNDALHALRAYVRPPARDRRLAARSAGRAFRSRRTVPPSAEGRWSLVEARLGAGRGGASDATAWSVAVAEQLLARYGVVSREVAAAEGIEGGFAGVYEVLRALEERGRIRRGYFAAGVGALQFALPAALDLLRSLRVDPDEPEVVWLSATDPANPYGVILRWPAPDGMDAAAGRGPTRSAGASVVLVNGRLGAWVSRSRQILTFLPEAEPDRTTVARSVAAALADLARTGEGRQGGLLVAEINGVPAAAHPLAPFLEEAGFVASALGFQVRREPRWRTADAGAPPRRAVGAARGPARPG